MCAARKLRKGWTAVARTTTQDGFGRRSRESGVDGCATTGEPARNHDPPIRECVELRRPCTEPAPAGEGFRQQAGRRRALTLRACPQGSVPSAGRPAKSKQSSSGATRRRSDRGRRSPPPRLPSAWAIPPCRHRRQGPRRRFCSEGGGQQLKLD
jgi:hypothetical protein